jgi:hypothetical protein
MIMRSLPNMAYSWIWIFLVLGLVAPVSAVAQSRSDTGRHQPEPPPEKNEDDTNGSQDPSSARPWHFGLSGGIQGGSDLFRVEVINGPAVPWDPATGGGFQSARFTASLDRNFSLGFFLTRDLGSIWSVRLDFGYSRMDVAAEALIGQTGAVFLFDRMNVLNLGLGVEARLARAASYPYLLASFLVSNLEPVRAEALAQTNLGGRLGLGYFHHFQDVWGLRLEARLAGTGFSVGDYIPQSTMPDQPVLDFTSEDHLVFFEFLVGMQANF